MVYIQIYLLWITGLLLINIELDFIQRISMFLELCLDRVFVFDNLSFWKFVSFNHNVLHVWVRIVNFIFCLIICFNGPERRHFLNYISTVTVSFEHLSLDLIGSYQIVGIIILTLILLNQIQGLLFNNISNILFSLWQCWNEIILFNPEFFLILTEQLLAKYLFKCTCPINIFSHLLLLAISAL